MVRLSVANFPESILRRPSVIVPNSTARTVALFWTVRDSTIRFRMAVALLVWNAVTMP